MTAPKRDERDRARIRALGQRIKALRGDRPQREFADDIGVDVSSLSRWERGLVAPDAVRLPDIARAAGVPVEALLTEDALVAGAA